MPSAKPPRTPARSQASKFCGSSTSPLRRRSPTAFTKNSAAKLPSTSRRRTFDISVLKLISTTDGDIFQVLSTNGDTHLGGDDIDNLLQAFVTN